MRNKTRKFIWSAPLVAAFAIIGALTLAGVLLLPNADTTEAQGAAPGAPTAATTPTTPNDSSVGVAWVPPAHTGAQGITGYEVEYNTGATVPAETATTWKSASTSVPAGATYYEVTGLSGTDTFWFRVRAVSGSEKGAWYTTAAGATLVPDTAPVSSGATVTVSNPTGASLDVSWTGFTDGGDDITSYTVTIARTDASEDADATCAQPGTATSTTCTSLTSGTGYTVSVTATNGVGTSTAATGTGTTAAPTITATAATIAGFSSSPGGTADLVMTITPAAAMPVGSSVVLFLEDDFTVPATIANSDAFFSQPVADSGNGAPASASRIVVDSDDYSHTGVDAHTIRIYVPDMNPSPDTTNGLADSVFTLRIVPEAGIKNDTEAGSYEVAYQLRGPAESIDAGFEVALPGLNVGAKTKLSDDANKRGYELVITANGLNKGRNAGAFVLSGQDSAPPNCQTLIVQAGGRGARVGEAVVDSVHTAVFTVDVTTDDFTAGETNYICVADDDANSQKFTNVKSFNLEPSVAASPAQVKAGDEVTIKLRDFPTGDDVMSVTLGGGQKTWTEADDDVDDFEVDVDGKELTFDMPGGLESNVEINVNVGGTNKQATITVAPGTLNLSKTEVAPNESIVITGDGFSEKSYIRVSNITIDGQPLAVDESGTEDMTIDGDTVEVVRTTSGGTFSATVRVWSEGSDNPALDDGTYEIEVTDANEFEATTVITIKGATLAVHPEIAGPRDYIKISGANWPVSTSDADQDVSIEVDGRTRSTGIDSTGRFYYEYQLRSTIQLGKDHTITVKYEGDGGSIEEEITFAVPSSNVTITPEAARPGDTVVLELTGMPIIELVDAVIIDGSDRLHNVAYTTDPDGDVTVEVTVPYADPGFYPVRIVVEDVTAIVQLEILGEARARGAAVPLPDALTDLGDNLEAVFYFDNVAKTWSFFDPKPEFAELNTLTELAENNPYWILIKEDQEVVLNGATRKLSCVGSDCWNLVIW